MSVITLTGIIFTTMALVGIAVRIYTLKRKEDR